MALLEHKATRGRALNPGRGVVREMACSGVRVQLALAPAGSGKTTAMAALTRAWEESAARDRTLPWGQPSPTAAR
ncbi:AAA family ATPase [Mycobacterium riyadhense]|uniref:AAA family ATPase n=1 Tax=Mycobacterium riyadhense TaxID=486698 RepID=UPI003B8A5A70